eukprot:Nitzschia sp. Nitz4//scaffold276_size25055//11457//12773//NITZ4_008341-RA/size25055-processed-gene-0.12-mRNA-1//-1//CDS//3329545325//2860//frame0
MPAPPSMIDPHLPGRGGYLKIEGDRETHLALQQQQHESALAILSAFGAILQQADGTLDELEANSNLLPTAILRKCEEFADGVGHLAEELESHTPEEQLALAQAMQQDFQTLDRNMMNATCDDDYSSLLLRDMSSETKDDSCFAQDVAHGIHRRIPSEDDILGAIQGASSLLRDVEYAFREVSEQDAEDIADAALTLARLFLLSLHNVHETLTPETLIEAGTATNRSMYSQDQSTTVVIEEIHGNEEKVNDLNESTKHSTEEKRRKQQRVRVLWPRLGPEVCKALSWGKDAATKRPLLAVALGLTMWPAAVMTTVVGGSLILADNAIQDFYSQFQEGPVISNLEQGAAQLFQAGKLGVLVSLVVCKHTLRVVQRQVKRHGGVGQIANHVKDAAIDRALHPMETISMAWDAIHWGLGVVSDNIQVVLEQREEFIAARELQ